MNPTSTAGSPIPSHGVRSASSMRPDDVSGRLAAGDSEPDRRQAVKADAIAPPLRGFGLDGLTPSRFGLPVQAKGTIWI